MGLFDRITKAVSKDLDGRVGGSDGSAEVRHEVGSDEARWTVSTTLSGGQGTISESGARGGVGKDLRGQSFTAEVDASGARDLVVLTATLVDDEQRRQTYSVEARPDDQRHAHLRLVVRFE